MLRSVGSSLRNFLEVSSTHGLKYLAERYNGPLVKLFWAATFLSCFCAAVISFGMVMIDWDQTPFMTTIESMDEPLITIQFPTITICADPPRTSLDDLFRPLLNSLAFSCTDESDCQDSQPLRNMMAPHLTQFTRQIFKMYQDTFDKNSLSTYDDPEISIRYFLNFCNIASLYLNITPIDGFLENMAMSIGKRDHANYGCDLNINRANLNLKLIPKDIFKNAEVMRLMRIIFSKMNSIEFGDLLSCFDPVPSQLRDQLYQAFFNHLNLNLNKNTSYIELETQYEQLNMNYVGGCRKRFEAPTPLDCSGFNRDLNKLMTVLKLGIHNSGFMASADELRVRFNLDQLESGFSLAKRPTGDERQRFLWNPQSYIPLCQFSSDQSLMNDCRLFFPVPTNKGICHAFNARHAFTLFTQPSEYEEAFRQAFEPEYHEEGLDKKIHRSPDVSTDLKVLLWDADSTGNFFISLSDQYSFFDVLSRPLRVRVGTETVAHVKPMVKMSYGLDKWLPEKRKCRFVDEPITDRYSIFNFYSKITCQQECRIAVTIKTCRCISWAIPFSSHYNLSYYPLCDFYGHECFRFNMNNAAARNETKSCESRCPEDCDQIKLKFTVTEVNALTNCKFITRLSNQRAKDYKEQLRAHLQSKLDDCDELISSMALLTVRFSSNTYVKYAQTVRVDVSGKVSQLGGTLGLFTGMSFISMVECGFWAIRSVLRPLYSYPMGHHQR